MPSKPGSICVDYEIHFAGQLAEGEIRMAGRSTDIRRVNLNLLPVLLGILRARNVTQAAKSLYLTQSATSGCLKRLRELFRDELLIPRGREMMLSEKARVLLPQLEEFLSKVSILIDAPAFDPASDNTRFRIATADWIGALLISKMSPRIQKSAPGVSVEITHGTLLSMVADLKDGLVDIIIGPKEMLEWSNLNVYAEDPDYFFELCFKDELVAIESTQTPCLGIETNLDTYLNHPHATFYLHPQMHASLEQLALHQAGLSQRDQFLVPHFTILPYLVAVTGAVAVVPSSLADQFLSLLPIRVFKPPLNFAPLNLIMVWSRARQENQALRWFRNEILDSFGVLSETGCDDQRN